MYRVGSMTKPSTCTLPRPVARRSCLSSPCRSPPSSDTWARFCVAKGEYCCRLRLLRHSFKLNSVQCVGTRKWQVLERGSGEHWDMEVTGCTAAGVEHLALWYKTN